MTRIHTYSQPIDADIVDAFCSLQKGFTDQFAYYDKQRACRYLGLGRCIALPSMEGVEPLSMHVSTHDGTVFNHIATIINHMI